MIRRALWAVYWRARAVVRLFADASWPERRALSAYGARELSSHLPWLRSRIQREAWVRLRGLEVRVALGRYELGGYMEVWLRRDYERLPEFQSRNGWVVVDVGANIGFFALRQAALGARVIAVEPNPDARRRLDATLDRNGLAGRVRVIGCAAGRAVGVAALAVGAATVTGTVVGGSRQSTRDLYSVDVRPLDSLVGDEPRVDLLKIDTEGAEVEVLRGAAALLGRTDRVVLEWHTPTLRAEAAAILTANGLERALARGSIDYYARPSARPNASRHATP